MYDSKAYKKEVASKNKIRMCNLRIALKKVI